MTPITVAHLLEEGRLERVTADVKAAWSRFDEARRHLESSATLAPTDYGQTGEKSRSGDGLVYDLAVTDDRRTVLVAGTFLDFGGEGGLLALDASSGRPSRWQAVIDRPVFGLAVWPADGRTVFAAAGGAGGVLAAFVPGGDPEGRWSVKTDGDNVGVVASESTVYLLGHYDFIVSAESDCYRYCPDGPERRHLAAFNARTGHLRSWNPAANTSTGPYAGAVGERHLYIGGEFINRRPQPGFAQFPGRP